MNRVLKIMKRPISTAQITALATKDVRKAERLYPCCDWPVPPVSPGLELLSELILAILKYKSQVNDKASRGNTMFQKLAVGSG